MKVEFKWGVRGFSGYADDAVYMYNRRLKKSYMRLYTYPARNPSADRAKLVMANLKLLQPSKGFKLNYYDYMLAFNELPENEYRQMLCWNNLYLRVMYAMQKRVLGVDLATLTRQDIYDRNLPCITVKAAVEAGYLPGVKDYERFDKLI